MAAFQFAMELDTAIMGGQSSHKRLHQDDVDEQQWSRRKRREFGGASQELPADLQVKHFYSQNLIGCEDSLGSLTTSTPRTRLPCERTQYQDDLNDHNITPHANTLWGHEDVEVHEVACDNTSLNQTSAEDWNLADKKALSNSVPEEEEEICFGMVPPRMQMTTIKALRGLTRLRTDLRRESSCVESVST
jgi:hypothetical protein